jgi:hypothetical protein
MSESIPSYQFHLFYIILRVSVAYKRKPGQSFRIALYIQALLYHCIQRHHIDVSHSGLQRLSGAFQYTGSVKAGFCELGCPDGGKLKHFGHIMMRIYCI